MMEFVCHFCSSLRALSRRRFVVLLPPLLFGALLVIVFYTAMVINGGFGFMSFEGRIKVLSGPHRKLLHLVSSTVKEPDRIGEKCTKSDVVINQGPTPPLPNGIPTYTVEIMNVCGTGCKISRIHVNCGWFSSDHLINPRIFKRLRYDDCLVNNGKPLANGETLSFQYANTYLYKLSVSSYVCA